MSSSIIKLISRSYPKLGIRAITRRTLSSSCNSSSNSNSYNSRMVKHVSESFVKPRFQVRDSKRRYYLAPLDLTFLSFPYMQVGLLFPKPPNTNNLLESLKNSLSHTLTHFYPLAGQLTTEVDEDRHQCSIFVDCHKGRGARLIHAAALGVTIADILTPVHVPDQIVNSFFDHHKAVNHDGHTRPLVSAQVTELLDGVFIGCSMNHVLGDGTSYWDFWNVWSETHRAIINTRLPIPRPPINDRWFPENYCDRPSAVTLPFSHPDEFITRHEQCLKRTRVFNFSAESLVRLKSKAHIESRNSEISTVQALCALFWRAYVKANRLPYNNITNARMLANNRHRLNPPLSPQYFGNFIDFIDNKTKVSDLLDHNLGWAASLLNHSVANHDDKAVREYIQQWSESPYVYDATECFNNNDWMLTNSPRFDVYGNDFGFGRPLAVRSGNMYKFGGGVVGYEGCEGGGSVDLEICLSPDSMNALESDPEFMKFVS